VLHKRAANEDFERKNQRFLAETSNRQVIVYELVTPEKPRLLRSNHSGVTCHLLPVRSTVCFTARHTEAQGHPIGG
jgi:hypothetical protein